MISCEVVPLLIPSTVGTFLAVLTQVNFAVLAADIRTIPRSFFNRATVVGHFIAVVAVRDMVRSYLNPLMVLQRLLAVEFKLTANTLQVFTLCTLKRCLLKASTSIALLTYQTSINSLF